MRLIICLVLILCVTDACAQTQPRLVLPIGHTNGVNSAQFSPNGKYVITSSNDNTARIYEAKTGKEIQLYSNVNGYARFSTNGEYLVTPSNDSTARIFEIQSGKELHKLSGHKDWIESAQFSPNSEYVITASRDRTAIIYETNSGKLFKKLSGHSGEVFSAQFSYNGKFVITASRDRTARIYDVKSGKEIRIFSFEKPISDIQMSPNGKLVLITLYGSPYFKNDPTLVTVDSEIFIYDLETGNKIHVLTGHTDKVNSAQFSPNGEYIVTASNDHTARIYQVKSGEQIHILSGHADQVNSAQFSPNGEYIVTASDDKTAKIYDLKSGKETHLLSGHMAEISSAQFSPEGEYIVTASNDQTARIYEVRTGNILSILSGHSFRTEAEFSTSGDNIYSITGDGIGRIYELKTGNIINILNEPDSSTLETKFSPNKDYFISISANDNAIRIYDAKTGKMIHNLVDTFKDLARLEFSPNGKFVAIASHDINVGIYEIRSGKKVHTLSGHSDEVFSAEFSPNNEYIITNSLDNTARIYDLKSGKELHLLTGNNKGVSYTQFSPNSQYVVASSGKTNSIYEVKSGKIIWEILTNHDFVTVDQFSSNGEFVSSRDNTAYIHEIKSGKLLHTLRGHTDWIASSKFSPDGKFVITASEDKTARIYDVKSGNLLKVLSESPKPLINARFSDNSEYIITSPIDKSPLIYHFKSGKKIPIPTECIKDDVAVLFSPNGKYIFTTGDDHKSILWDATTGDTLYTRLQLEGRDWLVYDKHYRFDGTPGAIEKLYFVCGLEVVELGQLKDSLWVPGLAEKILNGNDLLIGDKPAPKLSELNICDLTPVVVKVETAGNERRLRFRIKPRKGGLGETELYINGNLTYSYPPEILESRIEDGQLSYYLNLFTDTLQQYLTGNRETSNPLMVKSKVKNSGIYSRGAQVEVSSLLEQKTQPSFYGVFVGVNDYGNPYPFNNSSYRYKNLNLAEKDAEHLADAVEAVAKTLFNKDSIHIYHLTGENNNAKAPTKITLQHTLEEIGKRAKATDILYIFFAGHGDEIPLEGGSQIRFLMQQADKGNPLNSSFGVSDLMAWCHPARIRAQKRVFVFDACQSGKFSQEFAMNRSGDGDLRIRQLDKLKDKNGMMILAASAEDEKAYEDEALGQGVLTYGLLQVIQSQKQDTALLVRDWFDETIRRVEDYVRATNKKQSPSSFGDGRFEIGNVNDSVRKSIKIVPPARRIGRSSLIPGDEQTEKRFPDLEARFNEQLRTTDRGSGLVYSESNMNSYKISGSYLVKGKQLQVRYKLYFNEQQQGDTKTILLNVNLPAGELGKQVLNDIKKLIRNAE